MSVNPAKHLAGITLTMWEQNLQKCFNFTITGKKPDVVVICHLIRIV